MRHLPFSSDATDPLSKNDEQDTKGTNQKHNTHENHTKFQEPVRQNPGQHLVPDTKRQQRLCGNENGNQLGCVTIVTVDHVSNQHGKADKVGKLENCVSSEETDPVELVVRRAGEHCESDWRTDDSRKETPKTHLWFADTAILSSTPGSKAIADGADRDSQEDTEETADVVQSGAFLRPVPRGRRNEDGETEPDVQGTKTDGHAIKDDSPEDSRIDEEGELTP